MVEFYGIQNFQAAINGLLSLNFRTAKISGLGGFPNFQALFATFNTILATDCMIKYREIHSLTTDNTDGHRLIKIHFGRGTVAPSA